MTRSTTTRPLPSRIDAALDALDRAALRKTPQRIAIVRAFVDDDTHPTAQTIFERLRRSMPTMSFATVYNTLDALERAGSCRLMRVQAGEDASARFDPNIAPHDHFVCDRCGAIRDVALDETEVTRKRLPQGFSIRAVERVYRGLCATCKST